MTVWGTWEEKAMKEISCNFSLAVQLKGSAGNKYNEELFRWNMTAAFAAMLSSGCTVYLEAEISREDLQYHAHKEN